MKVLWLRPSKGDNISVRRERIAHHLKGRGYEIDIVDATGLDALRAIWMSLTGGYDIIAGNVRAGLFIGYPLAKIHRKPLLGDVSDPITDIDYLPQPLRTIFEHYEWFILERADASVFVYRSCFEEARKRGVSNAMNLPNAVDFDFFANPTDDIVTDAEQLLRGDGVDFDTSIAIYIGNFAPHYEIGAMLKAAELAEEWTFVFVGEGMLQPMVERAASSRNNVHYLGAHPHEMIPGFLNLADAGFCFKNAEQPLKIKEYGAAGLPIIVQPGELERYYEPEELVFVEPEPASIAKSLRRLADDEAYYQEKASRARSLASGLEWSDVADAYDRLFQDIAD